MTRNEVTVAVQARGDGHLHRPHGKSGGPNVGLIGCEGEKGKGDGRHLSQANEWCWHPMKHEGLGKDGMVSPSAGRRWNKRSRDHKCALHEFVLNSSIWGTLEIHQRRCHIDSWLQELGTQWAPGQRISCWAFCVSVVMATTVMREIKQK